VLAIGEWVLVTCIGCIVGGDLGNRNVLGEVPGDLLETTIRNPPVSLLGCEDNTGACLRVLIATRINASRLGNTGRS
jgi:hypothetical protein